jgi:hypothetical protein
MDYHEPRNRYPAVFAFFSSHFHQDWNHDYANAEEVITSYVRECGGAEKVQIVSELAALLGLDLTEKDFEQLLWFELCCQYVPTADGWPNMRAWVMHVKGAFAGKNGGENGVRTIL